MTLGAAVATLHLAVLSHRVWLAPLALMVLAGCGLVSGLDDYGLGDAGASAGGAGGGPAERALPHDDALIARYWIDRPATPVAGSTLRGAGPLDLDLQLSDGGGNLAWEQLPGGIGLRWEVELSGGRACARLSEEAFGRIDGLDALTIELVVAELAGTQVNPRLLFHVGTDDAFGLTLVSSTTAPFALYINNKEYARATVFSGTLRQVIHLTADLTAGTAFLIVGGAVLASLPPVGSETRVALFADAALCLGNREADDRSLSGVISYAALYGRALSLTEAQVHAAALREDDDGLLE